MDIHLSPSPITGEIPNNQQCTLAPSSKVTPIPTQEPASESFLTPSPSFNSSSTPSLAPLPSDTVHPTPSSAPSAIEQTPTPSPNLLSTPTPIPSPTLSPIPTISPTLKPTPTPTPVPTPSPSPLHTFAKLYFDERFEEYSFLLSKPPGIKLISADESAFMRQISVEQQTGDIIALWETYDRQWYLNEYAMLCIDPQKNNCFGWPAYFLYNAERDQWSFLRDLNTSGMTTSGTDIFGHAFMRSYIWWYLNRHYQSSLDPDSEQQDYITGIVLRHDTAQKRFWVVQTNDMPSDANGELDAQGLTPGIPYPPVRYGPDSWEGTNAATLGLIALQNAMTYSKHGLYFFESEYPDWYLRIHYYSFEIPVRNRAWATKQFTLRAGYFRGNPIVSHLNPHVAYSKKDGYLYFLRRAWTGGPDYVFISLMRITRIDAIP